MSGIQFSVGNLYLVRTFFLIVMAPSGAIPRPGAGGGTGHIGGEWFIGGGQGGGGGGGTILVIGGGGGGGGVVGEVGEVAADDPLDLQRQTQL